MRRQAIIAVLCLLMSKESLCEPAVLKTLSQDNVSAESAPRLYRNVPVYASSAPYAAYSIQIPTFISSPKAAASRIIPVKEVIQNTGYLRDSYGNRFVGAPQSFTYKAAFPQQFLKLQELPSHLSQPLVAAAPSYHYKQPSPFVVGSHYTLPLQGASVNHFSAPQQVAYPNGVKTVAPSSPHQTQIYGHPTAQQQSTSNNAVYANAHSQEQYRGLQKGQPFQRLQEVNKDVQINQDDGTGHKKQFIQKASENLQALPAKDTLITTVVNGQKTVIKLETKPPLPLLDISLLEPLTFDNPLVPQVQHFLPRINQATYHKLPKPNINENKNYQKEFVVQKTTAYDNGIKGKHRKEFPKNKQRRPLPESDSHEKKIPVNPTVTIKDVSNVSPDISYEINSPNYKETYKEQAISYNKETQSEPVHYTYGSKTEKEPVTYSYIHNSKEPLKIKEVHYENNGQDPKQLIYNFKTVEHPKEQNDKHLNPPRESENSGESDELEEERHINHRPIEHNERHEEAPKNHHHKLEHREEEYRNPPNQENHREKEYHHSPNQENHREEIYRHPPNKENHREKEYRHLPNQENHREEIYRHPPNQENHREKEYRHSPNQDNHREEIYRHPSNQENHREKEHRHSPNQENHREEIYYHPPNQENHKEIQNNPDNFYSQPRQISIKNAEQFHPIIHYEENIRIVPEKTAHIKVDPSQHIQNGQSHYNPQGNPSRASHEQSHQSLGPVSYQHDYPSPSPRPDIIAPQHIQEKSRRVIIQEETPEEMHSLREQVMAEMIEQEENNEEDFEKAYKNAAYGFPAYRKDPVDAEKEIYNPESYGVPRDHNDYDIEHVPFEQYQDEGDEYPKTTRSNYKDTRDKTKEDYYLDFSVSRPESLTDRYRNKANYYKLYKEQKPERYSAYDKDRKKENEKYVFKPVPEQKPKQTFAQYKAVPQLYEYDYSKEAPRDNSAYASRPLQLYKKKTYFVEPQFQYGFEPLAIPRLLDSELAAMATNNSPESEKPGMRKKVYKENWYIKKTRTGADNR